MEEKCLNVGQFRFVCVTGKRFMNPSAWSEYKCKPRDAWIAVYLFATMVARWGISYQIGTIWYIKIIGEKLLMPYMQQIIFPNSQGVYAQHHVKPLVFWEFTKTL
tara:strand:- start:2531 stop:2845 length:315 start_codon:yes stop_codon:yes gene_type:complete